LSAWLTSDGSTLMRITLIAVELEHGFEALDFHRLNMDAVILLILNKINFYHGILHVHLRKTGLKCGDLTIANLTGALAVLY